MNKLITIILLSLMIASCGSSDTDSTDGPSASDASTGDTNDTTDGEDGTEDSGNEELALSCAKQPTTTVNSGSAAKATFSFNQAINTKGVTTMTCSNSGATFAQKSVDVISGQFLVQQTVPAACETANFTIKLTVDNDDVDNAYTASCTWPVNKTIGFGKDAE